MSQAAMPLPVTHGHFFARPDPDGSLLETLAELDPTNPFVTPGFVRYRAGSGGRATPWVVGVGTDTRLESGCIGYLHHDLLPWSNTFEIHSFDARCMASAGFWEALLHFCQERRVKALSMQSFGSAPAVLPAGAGQVFQAREGDTVLSSILVLRAREGAYYHSAGTSPDGMQMGASHFLISRLAGHLRDEGLRTFNLGGADSDGLVRFKQGFGAVEVALEAATYFTGNWVSGALDRLKEKVKRGVGRG